VAAPFTPPEPPYVAVIFTSVQSDDTAGYGETAERMEQLASEQPGYLAFESARDPATRLGISVSYWRTEDDARAWKQVAEHRQAQRQGRARWYERYTIHIATVTRSYSFEAADHEDVADARIAAERMASPGRGIPLDEVGAEIVSDD
jgi:heme-degrading monooxygenase HmoA